MSKRYAAFLTALFCFFIGGMLLLNLLTPDRDFSPTENRVLQQQPDLKAQTVFSGEYMSSFERYVTDQMVGRDGWVSAKAVAERALGKGENNGVYLGAEETLIPRFDPPDEKRVEQNFAAVSTLADTAGVPVYFSLIPGKASVWVDRLPRGAPNADETEILRQAEEETQAQWIDVASALTRHKQENIYYRLDHHWTSLGAYYGYAALMRGMGIEPVPLESYEKTTVSEDFNGTAFSTSGVRWMRPDCIDCYVPESGVTVTAWKGSQPEEEALYDWSRLEEKDKYTFFLGGNKPLAVVRTQHTQEPRLLVIRDSYSDSLTPFLTAHFSQIHLFDPRYNKTPVSEYIQDHGIDAVLVLYSTANFVSDANLFLLAK